MPSEGIVDSQPDGSPAARDALARDVRASLQATQPSLPCRGYLIQARPIMSCVKLAVCTIAAPPRSHLCSLGVVNPILCTVKGT